MNHGRSVQGGSGRLLSSQDLRRGVNGVILRLHLLASVYRTTSSRPPAEYRYRCWSTLGHRLLYCVQGLKKKKDTRRRQRRG
ncbi:hypothetical protein SRHO_G00330360 [Serrasalmus rhombeus]